MLHLSLTTYEGSYPDATVHATGPHPPRGRAHPGRAAERAGCSTVAVSFYECGMRQPRLDIAAALARALDTEIESLFPEHCAAA